MAPRTRLIQRVRSALSRDPLQSLRLGFRNVVWVHPADPISSQALLVANHHGWHDETVMALVAERLGLPADSLCFAEGDLHPAPLLMPFDPTLDAATVPIHPVAIRYEMGTHERPECFVMVGPAMTCGPDLAARTRLEVWAMLDNLAVRLRHDPDSFVVLLAGTPDSDEQKPTRKD